MPLLHSLSASEALAAASGLRTLFWWQTWEVMTTALAPSADTVRRESPRPLSGRRCDMLLVSVNLKPRARVALVGVHRPAIGEPFDEQAIVRLAGYASWGE